MGPDAEEVITNHMVKARKKTKKKQLAEAPESSQLRNDKRGRFVGYHFSIAIVSLYIISFVLIAR